MSIRTLVKYVPLTLIAILLCSFLGACSFIATPTPTIPPPTATLTPVITPTPPAGWTIHTKPGLQIALPNSWQEFPLDDATLKSAIDAASTNNPHLANTLNGILTTGQNKNFVFYAADQATAANGNIIDNLSVSRTTVPAGTSVDQAVRQYAEALPQILKGAKVIAFDAPMQINGQMAGEVDYDLPLVNGTGQVVNARGVQFLFVPTSGDAYVVTVTGDATNADKFMPLARQIGKSFLIKP